MRSPIRILMVLSLAVVATVPQLDRRWQIAVTMTPDRPARTRCWPGTRPRRARQWPAV